MLLHDWMQRDPEGMEFAENIVLLRQKYEQQLRTASAIREPESIISAQATLNFLDVFQDPTRLDKLLNSVQKPRRKT